MSEYGHLPLTPALVASATLAQTVDLVRSGTATTRLLLAEKSGLGRAIVRQRVDQALALGLLVDAEAGSSTGGRAPRNLRFPARRGCLLIAALGATGIALAVTDLNGTPLTSEHHRWEIGAGPVISLEFAAENLERLRVPFGDVPIWGIGIGVPGPVNFGTGRPVAPPIMPGWNDFDIRSWMEHRFHAPVWVDNDVNMLAVGSAQHRFGDAVSDLLYIKVGSGVGAGLISGGRIHRGGDGAAGDIGHIAVSGSTVLCRCGQVGCLEAEAGGWALCRDALLAVAEGRSPMLTKCLHEASELTPAHISACAQSGDPASIELIGRSGRIIGEALAALVNFFNPTVIVLGGSIAGTGEIFLATVRKTVYSRSLPLATRNLRIESARNEQVDDAVIGAAEVVKDQLFGPALPIWIASGTPLENYAALY